MNPDGLLVRVGVRVARMEPIRARLFSFICLGDRRVGIQEVPKCEVADKIGSAGLEAVEVDEPSACLGIVSLEVTSAANAVLAEPFIAQSFKSGPDLVEGLEVTDLGHEVEDRLDPPELRGVGHSETDGGALPGVGRAGLTRGFAMGGACPNPSTWHLDIGERTIQLSHRPSRAGTPCPSRRS